MSNTLPRSNTLPTLPAAPALRSDGVLSSRLVAYLVDIVVIAAWVMLVGFFVLFLGFLTFGLAWYLFALLVPGAGIIYSAVTVGGARQATVGMRLTGLKVVRPDGGPVDWVTAAVHALFFYVAAGTGVVLLLDILVGLARPDRRLLHDLLAGVAIVR
jgi:uncharacterized RDD family membrane protein YckC